MKPCTLSELLDRDPVSEEVYNNLPFAPVDPMELIPLMIGGKIIHASPVDYPDTDGIDLYFIGSDGKCYIAFVGAYPYEEDSFELQYAEVKDGNW